MIEQMKVFGPDMQFEGYHSDYAKSSGNESGKESEHVEERNEVEKSPRQRYPIYKPKIPSNQCMLEKGMIFQNCAELKHLLIFYAVANAYNIRFQHCELKRLLVVCAKGSIEVVGYLYW